MANYVHTKVINLTPEMTISLGEILNSGKYYFRYKDGDNNFFDTNERTARQVLFELSGLYPSNEIITKSRYESYRYAGVFTEFYKNGEWIREEVRMDYYFEWAAEIDEKLKEYIEDEFTNHFNKFDNLITEPDILMDTNEGINISHSITIRKAKYKEITNKEIYHPIEYKGIKQGLEIFVSIGFDMDNLYEFEHVDNMKHTEDANNNGFCPIDDDDELPF